MKQLWQGAPIIWLVEDNPMDSALALRAFEQQQIRSTIRVFSNGAQVQQTLASRQNHDPLPDLILLDLKLPKIDGFQILEHLRQHPDLKLVPVIILSSSAEERDIRQAYELGANSYLVKPVDFDEFLVMVAEVERYWLRFNQKPTVR